MDLPHSDAIFVKAYPAETADAFLDGHVAAFAWLGGVPKSILYDNTKIAVAKILGDGKHKRTKAFSELQSHYLFEDRFGRPAKGNDKGKVEGLVGYTRRNFMVPLPRVHSMDELNAQLAAACEKRQVAVLRGHKTSIGERLKADRRSLMELPDLAFDPCEKVSTQANSLSLVRYRSNDYSVPTAYGHHDVQVTDIFFVSRSMPGQLMRYAVLKGIFDAFQEAVLPTQRGVAMSAQCSGRLALRSRLAQRLTKVEPLLLLTQPCQRCSGQGVEGALAG